MTDTQKDILDYAKPITLAVLLIAGALEASRRIEAAESAALDAARRVTAVESDVREISTDVRWIRRAIEGSRPPIFYHQPRGE